MRQITGALVLWLGLFSLSVGQDITGQLEGKVIDSESAAITGVNISVSGESIQGLRGAITDQGGRFRILTLPVGICQVRISHVGFHPVVLAPIAIQLGKTSNLGTIKLQSRTVQLAEVNIHSNRPVVDPNLTQDGGNLTASSIASLPVERNYRSAIALLPQANISYFGDAINMAGATGLENRYSIDGMNVTDPHLFRTGTNLPYNFVQEIETKTSGYQAEYGSALGGVVNVITYSGGNDFHGQAFGFFTNNRFSEEPRQPQTAKPKGAFSQYDVGFRLGGAFVRDRLWFFTAYNPTFEEEQVLIPGVGFYQDHSTIHSFVAKLLWRVNLNNSVVVTLLGDPQVRRAVGDPGVSFGTPGSFANPDPYLNDIRRGGRNLSLIGHHTLSKSLFLETAISQLQRRDQNAPSTMMGKDEPLFIDAQAQWSGGGAAFTNSLSTVTTVGVKTTYLTGNHILKAGVELRNNRLDQDYSGEVVQATGPENYLRWMVAIKGTVQNRIPVVFIQDSWQITPRLGMHAGVRWEEEYFIASTGKVAQRIPAMLQPRIGIVFQPGALGEGKLFASAGRFYQEISTWMASFNYIVGAYTYWGYYSHDPRENASDPYQVFEFRNSSLRPPLNDLEGRYYDAFSLGYEQQISGSIKARVLGTYHTLRQIIEDGLDPISGDAWFHNPGKGVLTLFPPVKREYTALEFSLEKPFDGNFGLMASYVLSRNYGNYTGLFNSDMNYMVPENGAYDVLDIMQNATGLLPNDRTHVFKAAASFRAVKSFQVGLFTVWQSGTPLNEFGGTIYGVPYHSFLKPRGKAGRTPSIWDVNLRLTYDLSTFTKTTIKPRLILDAFHIGSRRTPVNYEQIHYFNLDESGRQSNENPLYGQPSRFQPPMAIRLGMEVDF